MSNVVNSLTKEDWETLYVEQDYTLSELGEKFGVSLNVILNRLKKFGIKRKSCGRRINLVATEDVLRQKYVEEGKTFVCVAKELGCSERQIRKLVDEYGISRRKKPVDILTKEFLSDCLSSGKPILQISQEININATEIYKYMHKFGFSVGSSTKRKLVGEEKDVADLYKSGFTTTQLAKKYRVSIGVISRVLRTMGVEIRGANDLSKKVGPVEELCRLYFDEKMSVAGIAEYYDSTKYAVWAQFKKYGVKLRTKSESLLGENNGMYGDKHTEETRKHMSDAFVSDIRKTYSGCSISIDTPHQGIKKVRSSWEASVSKYFDENGVDYYYERTRFQLRSGSSYLPDFFLPQKNLYIEVKGYYRDSDRVKVEEFRNMGFDIEVWGLEKLKKLGLVDSCGKVI